MCGKYNFQINIWIEVDYSYRIIIFENFSLKVRMYNDFEKKSISLKFKM